MFRKITKYNYLVIAVLLLSFISCSNQKEIEIIISQAESIVEQHPDSALRLLNTVIFPEDLNKSVFNKYNLILLQAKDKNYKDITSDTVIFAVKDYYVRKKDIPNTALAAFYCGRLLYERKDIENAIGAYVEAEQLADQTDNYNLKGLIQGNMGILHRTHSSYEKAIELFKNAVKIYDIAQNYKNKITTLRSIGNCFALSNKIDSSFYYLNESLELAYKHNMPELQSKVKQSMGVVYREQGSYELAKKLFNESIALTNDSIEEARLLLNIAQVCVIEGDTDSVKFYLDKVLSLQIKDPVLMRTFCLIMSDLEEKSNRYSDALKYYKDYYNYTIEVFDNEKNNKLLEIQGKYDYEKLKNLTNRAIIKQQKTLALSSFVLLLAGIIIFLFYRKSEQNKILLLETEQKIMSLQKMADSFSQEKNTLRNYLLEHFDILKKTALLQNTIKENELVNGKKLLKKFNKIVCRQDTIDWSLLYEVMDKLNDGLYSKIRCKYPQIEEMEFCICCLTCETGFTDKEIEIVLGIKLNMIRRIRSDMRKKIGMSKGENYLAFFKNAVQK